MYGAHCSSKSVKGPASRILVYLGDASYSLYLSQFALLIPVMDVIGHSHRDGNTLVFALFCTTIAIGVLTYELVEKPLTRGARQLWASGPAKAVEVEAAA